MEILITHINYAGMNAREMIYKPLPSKSIEACKTEWTPALHADDCKMCYI